MARVEAKLAALGLVLPKPLQAPPGVVLPFSMVRLVGSRAIVSGHGPLNPDGTLAQPLGKVGSDLTIEQGYAAARLTCLAILASLADRRSDSRHLLSGLRAFRGGGRRKRDDLSHLRLRRCGAGLHGHRV
jgi:hypothetical protein